MSNEVVVSAHGGGGEMTRRLIAEYILPHITNSTLAPLTDGALLPASAGRVCFTTDAHVVQPLEFPGGDIGRLAVCGTVNDLAVMGAMPVALSLALVLEEGLPLQTLSRIMASVGDAAKQAGVNVATGDTKVVERGRGDGIHITTSGVGFVPDGLELNPKNVRAGDAILVSGNIADHGLAIMAAREGLGIDSGLMSDVAPMNSLANDILSGGSGVRFMRDPTRGGLAGVVADLAEESGLTVEIDEADVPLSARARHVSELLGLDPLNVANEGKLVVVVAEADADRVLEACRAHALGRGAAIVGRLVDKTPPLAELVTRTGGRRIIQRPHGAELPRIC